LPAPEAQVSSKLDHPLRSFDPPPGNWEAET
jgi:hypothetical protein